jgi:hypothetical protein
LSLRETLALHPEHRPSVPAGPGLGLGGRPGALASTSAMLTIDALGIEASAVQGSVFRELRPDFADPENTLVEYKGIGRVPVGHTGMTVEGQLLVAVQERMRLGLAGPYVADADHIPLTGSDDAALGAFRAFIENARDRTFFTVDPHVCMHPREAAPENKFATLIPAFKRAAEVIQEVKGTAPYVIELSIDEAPGMTTPAELALLLRAFGGAGMPLFSIAPAIGFDKKDQDGKALRESLRATLPALHRLAVDHGLLLGIHSGDGKGRDTLATIGDLTHAQVWYKVSPDRQRLLFNILVGSPPSSPERRLFEDLFQDLLQRVEAGTQSPDAEFALNCRECRTEFARWGSLAPRSDCRMIHDFGFWVVRDYKERLDRLSNEAIERYRAADLDYIRSLVNNLGLPQRSHTPTSSPAPSATTGLPSSSRPATRSFPGPRYCSRSGPSAFGTT